MINPAEDIVNIWLQECQNHFTMSNVYVKKKTRIIRGKKVGGGRGKEIDIISTDWKKSYWVEVSVSPRPRLPKKSIKMNLIISWAADKFDEGKREYLEERFKGMHFEKWYVYSPKLFSKHSKEQERFCSALKKRGIKALNFEDILSEVREKLDYMGYDVTRNYLYLLKMFTYS